MAPQEWPASAWKSQEAQRGTACPAFHSLLVLSPNQAVLNQEDRAWQGWSLCAFIGDISEAQRMDD